MASREPIYERFKEEQLFYIPVGLFSALYIIGLVIFYSRNRLSISVELAIAVERRELINYYQPIVNLDSGQCIGAEVLIRWHRSNGEIIYPDSFIPQAEESGLLPVITDQIIDSLLIDLGAQLIANKDLHLSINLSASDTQTGRMITVLEAKLSGTGIVRNQIWLEVTERDLISLEAAKKTINQARNLGYVAVIDDFGTGYSNLSYLQNFSLDVLKIDKSFVSAVGTPSVVNNVTYHIIQMAKTLKLQIVAEGVENKNQLAYFLKIKWNLGGDGCLRRLLERRNSLSF